MTKRLTESQKRKYIDILYDRDGGFKCFYCDCKLSYMTSVFEHLNNDPSDNRIDNLVLSCQSCNIKKINDRDMIDKAETKLDQNEHGLFVGERKYEDSTNQTKTTQVSKEIDINKKNFEITEKYITSEIESHKFILYKDALSSSAMLCKKETGHGSLQSVRNYILMLTSKVGEFEITKNDKKKKVIQFRNDL